MSEPKIRHPERDVEHAVRRWALAKLRAYHAESQSDLDFDALLERLDLNTLKADFRIKLNKGMHLVLAIEALTSFGVPFIVEIPYESIGTLSVLREVCAANGGVIH